MISLQQSTPPPAIYRDNSREFDFMEKLLQDAKEEELRQKIAREEAIRAYVNACRELEYYIVDGLQILLEAPSNEINLKRSKLQKQINKAMKDFLHNCNPEIKEKKQKSKSTDFVPSEK